MNHEAMIRACDIREARSRLRSSGPAATIELFSREPLLARAVANRTAHLVKVLVKAGLPDGAVTPVVMPALVASVLEPLLTLDAAHQRLMDDLLPGEDLRPVRLIPPDPAFRTTFAVTSIRPVDVKTLAPEMTKDQTLLFLTDQEGEIAMAMRQAGIEALKVLLARKDASHGNDAR